MSQVWINFVRHCDCSSLREKWHHTYSSPRPENHAIMWALSTCVHTVSIVSMVNTCVYGVPSSPYRRDILNEPHPIVIMFNVVNVPQNSQETAHKISTWKLEIYSSFGWSHLEFL